MNQTRPQFFKSVVVNMKHVAGTFHWNQSFVDMLVYVLCKVVTEY